MAGGVPIVAQREWGWCEMVEHGVTGFLGGDDCELAHFAAMLAHDEELRLHVAERARQRLVTQLRGAAEAGAGVGGSCLRGGRNEDGESGRWGDGEMRD